MRVDGNRACAKAMLHKLPRQRFGLCDAAPADNHVRPPHRQAVWVPGHWAWRHEHYVWAPGHWEVPVQPGYVWVPGGWVARGGGYAWVEGHWRAR